MSASGQGSVLLTLSRCRSQKASPDLGARIFRFRFSDQAGCAFALKLRQLIAIDGNLPFSIDNGRLLAAHQRMGENNGDSRRQYGNENPEHSHSTTRMRAALKQAATG